MSSAARSLQQEPQRSSLRVCCSAFHAYPLFDPRVKTAVGGLETHAWQLARGLAADSDWEVHFVVKAPRVFRRRRFGDVIVWNCGDGLDAIRNDVSHTVQFDGRWPTIAHWHPRLLWQLPLLALARLFQNSPPPPTAPDRFYSRINPDIYCCFGVSGQSASVVASARAAERPSVLFLESNSDLDERFGPDSTYVTPNGERGDVCWFAVQNATRIVTQHTEQQRLLVERFGRTGDVLPNLIDLADWDRAAKNDSPLLDTLGLKRFVLWVGRADTFHKRPQLCLQLARILEEIPFLMILNPCDAEVERGIREAASPNIIVVKAVPFSEMPALMRRADVLLSTGSMAYEGAPNVFLQAAASRIPTASLEVPLPVGVDAGFVADGDLDRLATYIRECWDDPRRAQTQGQYGRHQVERQHDLPVVTARLTELLREVFACEFQ